MKTEHELIDLLARMELKQPQPCRRKRDRQSSERFYNITANEMLQIRRQLRTLARMTIIPKFEDIKKAA